MLDIYRKNFDNSKTYDGYDENNVFILNNIDQIKGINFKEGKTLIEIPNTIGLTKEFLNEIPNNVYIRIIGGYTNQYMNGLKAPNYSNLREKVTYSINELKDIIDCIDNIENQIDDGWNDYKKALFVYEYLKKNILYRVPKQVEGVNGIGIAYRNRNWDSLTGLLCNMSTCNGFAFIYQELLTRLNIKCYLIGGSYIKNGEGQHAFNVVSIDGNNFLVDIIWDAMEYEKGNDQITGCGLLNKTNYRFKNNKELYSDLINFNLNSIDDNNKISR